MCDVTYDKYTKKYHLTINGKSIGMYHPDELASMAFTFLREIGAPNV